MILQRNKVHKVEIDTMNEKFEDEMKEKDKEFDEAVSPEDICCLLQNCIKVSEADVMETKILCQNSKPYWNSELTALSNNVRQARKVYRSNNSITNKQVLEECRAEFADIS